MLPGLISGLFCELVRYMTSKVLCKCVYHPPCTLSLQNKIPTTVNNASNTHKHKITVVNQQQQQHTQTNYNL